MEINTAFASNIYKFSRVFVQYHDMSNFPFRIMKIEYLLMRNFGKRLDISFLIQAIFSKISPFLCKIQDLNYPLISGYLEKISGSQYSKLSSQLSG